MLKKGITEFIGTFFIVIVAAFSYNPIAIGSVLMCLIYMGFTISGAHFNPIVTLAVWMQGKISPSDAWKYIGFQFLGAFIATAVYTAISGSVFAPGPAATSTFMQGLLMEGLFSFLLVSVVLNVACSKRTIGNSYYGLAIGFTVLAAMYAGKDISGTVLNPAIALGSMCYNTLNQVGDFSDAALYILGPVAGSMGASFLFRFIEKEN